MGAEPLFLNAHQEGNASGLMHAGAYLAVAAFLSSRSFSAATSAS